MTGLEIYQRTAIYERDARTIRLHAPEWKCLLAYDGRKTVEEIGVAIGIPLDEALPLTARFLQSGWIEEQPITLDQYLKRTGAATVHVPTPVPKPELSTQSAPPPLPVAPAPASEPKVTRGAMRLSSVVDYITSLVGNTSLGQLLVYRVFLRVPAELLQEEDVVSVQLVGDTSLIRGEKLQQAIARAVQEVTQRPLPDGVYAAA